MVFTRRRYAGTDGGIFVSADGGASWRPLTLGLRASDRPLPPVVPQ